MPRARRHSGRAVAAPSSGLGTVVAVLFLLCADSGAACTLGGGAATPPGAGTATAPGAGSATSRESGDAPTFASGAFPDFVEPSPARRRELADLLKNDCGACHGGRLRGGLGVPLVPEALEGKSVEALARAIYYGIPDTPMPPWGRFLTREEAAWLASQLKKGAPIDRR